MTSTSTTSNRRSVCNRGCCFECDVCARKTGSPVLCHACYRLRYLCGIVEQVCRAVQGQSAAPNPPPKTVSTYRFSEVIGWTQMSAWRIGVSCDCLRPQRIGNFADQTCCQYHEVNHDPEPVTRPAWWWNSEVRCWIRKENGMAAECPHRHRTDWSNVHGAFHGQSCCLYYSFKEMSDEPTQRDAAAAPAQEAEPLQPEQPELEEGSRAVGGAGREPVGAIGLIPIFVRAGKGRLINVNTIHRVFVGELFDVGGRAYTTVDITGEGDLSLRLEKDEAVEFLSLFGRRGSV